MSGGLPPPRTSWPDSGPLRPPRLPHPRHAAGDSGRADEPGRAGDAIPAGPATSAAPETPAGDPNRTAGPRRTDARADTEQDLAPSHRRETRLERIYVITGGRSGPPSGLDLVTLIVAADSSPPNLSPEQATIMRLCRRPLSVAELSAHLRLPFSATAVLVADLLTAGLALQRRPVRPAHVDPELLKQVINGLRRL